ncbi:MAG: histidine--tRNA ligase, partial [Bryobacteraceae bacterium]
AYIEHRLDQQPGLKKLYYMGPMFRRERPQKGRFRQFYQIGAEAIGSESPLVDAEVIEMVTEVLARAGIEGYHLIVNSVGCSKCRPVFVATLKEALRDVAPRLCQDCQRRAVTNPLRVLDCKVPEDQPLIEGLPSILDSLDEECRAHFEVVKACLQDREIAFEVRPRLVRGLDYYMRTTFEIVHGSLGAQNSVLGGGRYDGLAEAIGSKVAAPGIGFSIGEDRLVMTVEDAHPESGQETLDVFVVPLGAAAARQGALLARDARRVGLSAELSTDSKAKRAFEAANKLGARVAVILGDNEMEKGVVSLKNMTSGEQRHTGRETFLDELRKELKNA